MPGFGGGDQTLLVLAAWLRRIGYRPHMCGFVANTGCSDRAVDRVERRLEGIHDSHGRRVALIGHSRGGHYVRALAHRRPELVSHADLDRRRAASDACGELSDPGRGRRGPRGRAPQPDAPGRRCASPRRATASSDRDFAAPFPSDRVRLTSIYSKEDGVVRWQSALVPDATAWR